MGPVFGFVYQCLWINVFFTCKSVLLFCVWGCVCVVKLQETCFPTLIVFFLASQQDFEIRKNKTKANKRQIVITSTQETTSIDQIYENFNCKVCAKSCDRLN